MNQRAGAVCMVAPTSFGFDEQTAVSNTFQHKPSGEAVAVQQTAQQEFDHAVATLRQHDIGVEVFTDASTPPKPNAVFPNNWFSTWPDGTIFLYPMATPSRRLERSDAVIDMLRNSYNISSIIDLSDSEAQGRFLEGTGAMVFDHPNKLVYGCLSPRCNETLLRAHAHRLDHRPVIFHAFDSGGVPIYHTNVVLAVQTATAVVCSAAITNPNERKEVISSLKQSGHEVIDITQDQLSQFCGNVLEIENAQGQPCLVLSQTAYDAFTPAQRQLLARDKTLVPIDIPTIERVGGGSARCMLAELFLPPKKP